MNEDIAAIQQTLKDYGYDVGPVDGVWGPKSQGMLLNALKAATSARPLCWGQRVSPAFRAKVRMICAELAVEPDYLMACMAFESAGTFRPDIKNAAGSGAVGLIQFMPSTAAALGTSPEALARLSAESQLDYVKAYFKPWKGRLETLSDVYLAILFPVGVGKSEDFVLFDRADIDHPKRYIQNAGLDFNRDGKITKAEAAARVTALYRQGLAFAA